MTRRDLIALLGVRGGAQATYSKPGSAIATTVARVDLRTSRGSRRRPSLSSSIRSNIHMKMLLSFCRSALSGRVRPGVSWAARWQSLPPSGFCAGARDETRIPTATKAGGRNAARSAGYAFVPWPAKVVTKGSSFPVLRERFYLGVTSSHPANEPAETKRYNRCSVRTFLDRVPNVIFYIRSSLAHDFGRIRDAFLGARRRALRQSQASLHQCRETAPAFASQRQ
jgi:hypothetical protein